MIKKIVTSFLLFLSGMLFSQVTQDSVLNEGRFIANTIDSIPKKKTTDSAFVPRSPEKAALYSAALPGLGQIYNKRYIKAGVIWGLMGTGIGFTAYYQGLYSKYRNAYVSRLNDPTYQYQGRDISAETLALNMNRQKRYRDYAIAITTLVYALNVIDAIVDAHLDPIRKDPDLKIKPTIIQDESSLGLNYKVGVGMSFKF